MLQGHWRREGQCQKWIHFYCVDVTLGLYEERSSSELCFTCCQIQQNIELRGKVDMLRLGLSQLKAQLQLTRSQILLNKLSTKRGEANGSWQRVKTKQHARKRHCSQQGATQTTEVRARRTATLDSRNEPEVRLKCLVLVECGKRWKHVLWVQWNLSSLGPAPIPLLKWSTKVRMINLASH